LVLLIIYALSAFATYVFFVAVKRSFLANFLGDKGRKMVYDAGETAPKKSTKFPESPDRAA
jgi:hypothetical protein